MALWSLAYRVFSHAIFCDLRSHQGQIQCFYWQCHSCIASLKILELWPPLTEKRRNFKKNGSDMLQYRYPRVLVSIFIVIRSVDFEEIIGMWGYLSQNGRIEKRQSNDAYGILLTLYHQIVMSYSGFVICYIKIFQSHTNFSDLRPRQGQLRWFYLQFHEENALITFLTVLAISTIHP